MKRRISGILICTLILTLTVLLSACGNESEELQAQIDELQAENAALSASLSSAQSDLTRAQGEVFALRGQLESIIAEREAEEEEAAAQEAANDPAVADANITFAITYGGRANADMSWPLAYGTLPLGLRVNPDEIDDGAEITWRSTNTNIFTVEEVEGEGGLQVIVTPLATGNARIIATVGPLETYSWIRVR